MLVLSMIERDRIAIGDPKNPLGWILLVSFKSGGRIRLGFEFPEEVQINREAVVEKIKAGEPRP